MHRRTSAIIFASLIVFFACSKTSIKVGTVGHDGGGEDHVTPIGGNTSVPVDASSDGGGVAATDGGGLSSGGVLGSGGLLGSGGAPGTGGLVGSGGALGTGGSLPRDASIVETASLPLFDAEAAGDVPVMADAFVCPSASDSRVEGDGTTVWSWRFVWQRDDLASVCASYGTGAKMVLEINSSVLVAPASALPSCTVEETMGIGSRTCVAYGMGRIEADCLAGELEFEMTTNQAPRIGWDYPNGYYHIESSENPNTARKFVQTDTTCSSTMVPHSGPIPDLGTLLLRQVTPITANGSPDFDAYTEPAANGQPCQFHTECTSNQQCFIDAQITDCLAGPVGHCVFFMPSNCVAYPGCRCIRMSGLSCGGSPGLRCDYIVAAPNPQPATNSLCAACFPFGDAGY